MTRSPGPWPRPCAGCGHPITPTPKGRPAPAGHRAHAARSMCPTCYRRAAYAAARHPGGDPDWPAWPTPPWPARHIVEQLTPPRWMSQALCAQTDPDLFFPDPGGSPRPALRICASCPVRADCLAWALARHPLHGVWGGTSQTGRDRLARDLRAAG